MKNLRFHHVGVACRSIERDARSLESLGFRREDEGFRDHSQGVAGCFMTMQGFRVELLEGIEGSTTLLPWIERGIKMYHVGYLTPSLEDAAENLKRMGAKLVSAPTPAPAFGGKSIMFLMLPSLDLIELIEA